MLLNPRLKKKLIHLDQLQEKYSLSNSQVSILILLSKYHSLTVSEISRRLDMAKPNITPVVERLYRRGLVSREHDDEDRRPGNVGDAEHPGDFLRLSHRCRRPPHPRIRVCSSPEY